MSRVADFPVRKEFRSGLESPLDRQGAGAPCYEKNVEGPSFTAARVLALLSFVGRSHTNMQYDILIRGGDVIDPSQNLRGIRDVAVKNGKIAAVEEILSEAEATHVIDGRGLTVVPGLIDLHVHVYSHCPLGLDADSLCAAGGVTTMLDTGSAGSNNFGAFVRDDIRQSETQVFGLVNLSCIGLVAPDLGELMDPPVCRC